MAEPNIYKEHPDAVRQTVQFKPFFDTRKINSDIKNADEKEFLRIRDVVNTHRQSRGMEPITLRSPGMDAMVNREYQNIMLQEQGPQLKATPHDYKPPTEQERQRFQEGYKEAKTKARWMTGDSELAEDLASNPQNWSDINKQFNAEANMTVGTAALATVLPQYIIPGLVGGKTVDWTTQALSNYDSFGQMVENELGVPKGYGDFFNFGYYLGPGSWNLVKNGFRNTYNSFNNRIRKIYDNGKLSGQALSDLFQYVRSSKYKDKFTINPQTNQVSWTKEIPEGNVPFVQEAISRKHPMNRKFDSFYIDTEKGTIQFNPELGSTTYTSKLPEQWGGWGETYLATVDGRTSRMVLTSPRVDQGGTNLNLPNTLPKDVIKDFWITGRATTKPGTYISGDEGIYPIGYYAIQEYKNNGLLNAIKTALYPKTYPYRIRTGLSPDSYSSIIRQAQREGSKLRWGEGFYNWNPSAVENKHISDAFNAFKKGTISLQEYQKIFNEWALPLGGRPLQFITNSQGKTIPIHPHPYIYIKKNGGKFIKWASSTDLGLIKKKSNNEQ